MNHMNNIERTILHRSLNQEELRRRTIIPDSNIPTPNATTSIPPKETLKTLASVLRGECSHELDVGKETCQACADRQPFHLNEAYDWRDLSSLVNKEDRKFNPSLLRYRGRLILAMRVTMSGSQIHLLEISDDFMTATRETVLEIDHRLCDFACEDPRLFIHKDKLHIAFSGVQKGTGRIVVHQMYARLNDDLHAEAVYYPHFHDRADWEKNWGFFSSGDQLYAVYSIQPHTILRIDGDQATRVHQSETKGWSPMIGLKRGGASPVKRGSEWYCFFHDAWDAYGKPREYNICLYTFEDRPPFRINRIARVPLFRPDAAHRPNKSTPNVIFPGSAFLEDHLWHVAAGYYDQWSLLLRFDVNRIERLLDVVPSGRDGAYTFRSDEDDYVIWHNVFSQNEYELPDSLAGQRVVDVGGHIGAFAKACLDRGAASVLSIEPHPVHRELFATNLREYAGKWTLISGAAFGKPNSATTKIVGRGCGVRLLDLAPHHNGNPYEVPEVDINQYLEDVDLLKIDCEGAEHEILANADLSGVRMIVGEGHTFDGLPSQGSLVSALESRGFNVRVQVTGTYTFFFWATAKAVLPPKKTLPVKAYCITCDQIPWRRKQVEQVFADANLQVEMFRGLHGPTFGIEARLGAYNSPTYKIGAGFVGLHLTNLLLWNVCLERPHDAILVFEDDVVLVPDFLPRLTEALAALPDDWQIVHVGSCCTEGSPSRRINEHVSQVHYPLCTHAMLYRKSVLPFVIEKMMLVCNSPIDQQLHRLVLPYVKHYTLIPPLASQTHDREGSYQDPDTHTTLGGCSWKDIQGWFDFADVYDAALDRISGPATFVEVGSWLGKSTAYMAEEIKRRYKQVKFFAVDTWQGSVNEPDLLRMVAEAGGDLFPQWQKNMSRAGVLDFVTPMQMTSLAAASQFTDSSLDFCFIDGDHSYAAVRDDIAAWRPKMKPAGMLAGHDYDQADVRRAVDESGLSVSTHGRCWVAAKPA